MERIEYLREVLSAVGEANQAGASEPDGQGARWSPDQVWALAEGLWLDKPRPAECAPLSWREAERISAAWRAWMQDVDGGTANSVIWDTLL